ncbi:MAG: DNA polymerase III subunit delta, partial [Deltaproteobacteria bacterium]|nr:DNA polymerase III subunit delta [Deltaproteobacteria bacterium]
MPDLERQIAAGTVDPVYVLGVKDALLAERVVSALRDQVVPEAVRGFNYDVVEPGRASADVILAAATTLPMMAERR